MWPTQVLKNLYKMFYMTKQWKIIIGMSSSDYDTQAAFALENFLPKASFHLHSSC